MYTNNPDKILSEIRSFADEGVVRISISNLISDIKGDVLGIINKKGLLFGRKKLSSIGGGAELYDRTYLESIGGFDFEKGDCKFKIPIENVPLILEMFKGQLPDFIEAGPDRELREELCEEILLGFQDESILDISELSKLTANYSGTMFDSGFGVTSTRKEISLYVWRYFTLGGRKDVIKKIYKSGVIHCVSLKECQKRTTQNGIFIGPNVIAASDLIYE